MYGVSCQLCICARVRVQTSSCPRPVRPEFPARLQHLIVGCPHAVVPFDFQSNCWSTMCRYRSGVHGLFDGGWILGAQALRAQACSPGSLGSLTGLRTSLSSWLQDPSELCAPNRKHSLYRLLRQLHLLACLSLGHPCVYQVPLYCLPVNQTWTGPRSDHSFWRAPGQCHHPRSLPILTGRLFSTLGLGRVHLHPKNSNEQGQPASPVENLTFSLTVSFQTVETFRSPC